MGLGGKDGRHGGLPSRVSQDGGPALGAQLDQQTSSQDAYGEAKLPSGLAHVLGVAFSKKDSAASFVMPHLSSSGLARRRGVEGCGTDQGCARRGCLCPRW